MKNWPFLFILFLTWSCATHKPYYNENALNWEQNSPPASAQPEHSVFLIGDAGKPKINSQEPVLLLLDQHLQNLEKPDAASLVFLGDNIYPKGLPDPANQAKREEAEKYLIEQLKVIKNFSGKSFIIPGNHDWAQGRKQGLQNALNQEAFVSAFLNNDQVFQPTDACAGPVEVPLNDDLMLILVNTQWWFHQWDKPGIESDCEAKGDLDFLLLIKDALERHRDKKVIFAAHHPLISNGSHGGHFPASTHLFPFGIKKKPIPLPVLGSAYVGFRKFIGSVQDIPNVRYRQLRNYLFKLFEEHPHLTYVAGHDHNLQHHPRANWHHIVSGSGSKTTYVARKKKADFAYAQKGFARLDYYASGELWLSFWVPEGDDAQGKLVYQRQLFSDWTIPTDSLQAPSGLPRDTVYRTGINEEYDKVSGFKKWNLGKNYRKEWAQPIDFPVFDIDKMKGGLKIIKRGGGQATNSLRLEAADKRQYVLRSVDKQGDKALTDDFRGTFLADIVQDQTSAAHPYGPLVVPTLAEAAGIHHSNPQYFYLPKDPRLGKYQFSFGGKVYLFEERADDDLWSDYPNFGYAPDIKSTAKVVKKIQGDNDERIDELSVLKHRLFDIWIGDWDRHDDQWRWARYKTENGHLYRPLPRDRDQTFFLSDGWIVRLGTRKWGIRKFQGFQENIRDVNGLNNNARFFDRYFLTQPDKNDWLATMDSLQKSLTDQVIEKAMLAIPSEVASFHNDQIIEKLKSRRDNMARYVETYYRFLSRKVNVLGSDKHELFEIQRLNDQETMLRVYKVKKESRKKIALIYERMFRNDETREIRLYGLDGNDEFKLEGEVKKGLKVRIIGGGDKDKVQDLSLVRQGAKKTWVYDKPKGMDLQPGPETKNKVADKKGINRYDRQEFRYNYFGPSIFLGFNLDDGLFLGGGINMTTHAFRKQPYATRQQIKANYAIATNSYNFVYKGEFKEVLGKFDFVLDADLRAPNYVQNFFGLGNESPTFVEEEGINFHRIRYEQYLIHPQVRREWLNRGQSLSFGLLFQSVKVERNEDRFINDFETNGLDSTGLLENRMPFGALSLDYQIDTRKDKLIPTQGIVFKAGMQYVQGLDDETLDDIRFLRLKSSFATYLPLGGSTSLALRVGGAHNFGDFLFFQANALGGSTNLRGYRNFRFSGRSSIYQNTELRIKLFKLRSFLFNGTFGLIGINDIGRVWVNGENSNRLHHGYGGGIWFTPAQALVVSATYTRSSEDDIYFIRFGFLF